MHFHWQNLNERRQGADGRTPLGIPLHGRCWLRLTRGEFGLEWALGGNTCGVGFQSTGSDWKFSLGVPLFAVWFTIAFPFAQRDYRRGEREASWRVFDWSFWWHHWTPGHEWSSTTPKWRNGSFCFRDFVLGKPRHAARELAWRWVRVPMPERTYYGAACLEEASWSRPRWRTRRIVRCEIKMLPGEQIPFPGKGENSWDCGEDASYGFHTPADSIDDGIAKLVGSVLRSRTRHGGRDWAPESKAPDLGGALPVQP